MGQYGNQPDFGTEAFSVTANDTINTTTNLGGCILYVGGTGNVKVLMAGKTQLGDAVTFTNIPDGTFLPIVVDYVLATGTTATAIIGVK
jgi:hypothetical protein|tara:strand:+ start:280 stop:546 length:267 start_codon:yes stop_codon:yes gene_type:complete